MDQCKLRVPLQNAIHLVISWYVGNAVDALAVSLQNIRKIVSGYFEGSGSYW